MAQTDNSLTRAARKKATSAGEKARLAEGQLAAANEDLKDAIDHREPVETIKRAHFRTQVAEKAVAEAAHDIEVVEVLLDVAQGGTPA
jgi:hypothetical protein